MRVVRGGDGLMRLQYQITAPAIVERRQDAELSLGMFLNFFRECCGPSWAPEEVHFEHPNPPLARARDGLRRADLFFAADQRAALYARILARPMPASDVRLLAMMQTCLEQLGAETPADDALLDHVKTAIRMKLPRAIQRSRRSPTISA